MRKPKLDEWPLGTLFCGGLLVLACAFFGWWSAAQAAVHPAREIHRLANGPDSLDLKASPVLLEQREAASRRSASSLVNQKFAE